MWILEAISETPLKQFFLNLVITLGACFLLLALFFSQNALFHPVTYVALAAALWNSAERTKPLIALIASALLFADAYLLLPSYPFVFAVICALVIGYTLYAATFEIWKCAVAAILLYGSMIITLRWQTADVLSRAFPEWATFSIEGAIFGFCSGFSLLILFLRKDPVQEAIDSVQWRKEFEADEHVTKIGALYRELKQLPKTPSKMRLELCQATRKMILTCGILQQIETELANTDPEELKKEICWLEQKTESVTDTRARMQYEQALKNKTRRSAQIDEMLLQRERICGRLLNYVSALENIRFARNHGMGTDDMHADVVDFFLDVAQAEAGV